MSGDLYTSLRRDMLMAQVLGQSKLEQIDVLTQLLAELMVDECHKEPGIRRKLLKAVHQELDECMEMIDRTHAIRNAVRSKSATIYPFPDKRSAT